MATQAAQSETDKNPAIPAPPAPAAGDGPLKGLLFSAAFLLIAARLAIPAAMALWPDDAAPSEAPLVLPAAAEAPAEERSSGESAASAGFGFLARLSALG